MSSGLLLDLAQFSRHFAFCANRRTSNVRVPQKENAAEGGSEFKPVAKAQTKVFFHPRGWGCQSSDYPAPQSAG
jgi:hypothetical protein